MWKQILTFRPAWNGKRWLVPCRLSRTREKEQLGRNTFALINEDAMVAAVKAGSAKLNLRKLFRHSDTNSLWAFGLYFLPREESGVAGAGPPGGVGDDMDLWYTFRRRIPEDKMELDRYSYSYGIQPVNGKGGKAGPAAIVEFPEWKPNVIYQDSMFVFYSNERISGPIAGGDGNVYVAMCRGLEYTESLTSPPFDLKRVNELNLFSVDRKSGNVTVVASGKPSINGAFERPYLHWFRNRICVLNSARFLGTGVHQLDFFEYFSRFKP
jgi:hypothetical protein